MSTVTWPVSDEIRLSSASQGAAESTWSESTGLSPSGPCRAAEGSHWILEGGGAAWGTASKMSCGCQGHRQPAEILLGEEKKEDPDLATSLPSDLCQGSPVSLEQSEKSRESKWGER